MGAALPRIARPWGGDGQGRGLGPAAQGRDGVATTEQRDAACAGRGRDQEAECLLVHRRGGFRVQKAQIETIIPERAAIGGQEAETVVPVRIARTRLFRRNQVERRIQGSAAPIALRRSCDNQVVLRRSRSIPPRIPGRPNSIGFSLRRGRAANNLESAPEGSGRCSKRPEAAPT